MPTNDSQVRAAAGRLLSSGEPKMAMEFLRARGYTMPGVINWYAQAKSVSLSVAKVDVELQLLSAEERKRRAEILEEFLDSFEDEE